MAEPLWTLGQVMQATHGHCLGDDHIRVEGLSIDTRGLARGDAFIAIHGPNHDGHAFVACLLYTSPSPRDRQRSRMPSSA